MQIANKRNHTPTPADVYVGRPSPLGNPHPIGWCRLCRAKHERGEAIKPYARWLYDQILAGNTPVIQALNDLKPDSVLVCWCSPQPCHAEIIIRCWTWLQEQQDIKLDLATGFARLWPGLIGVDEDFLTAWAKSFYRPAPPTPKRASVRSHPTSQVSPRCDSADRADESTPHLFISSQVLPDPTRQSGPRSGHSKTTYPLNSERHHVSCQVTPDYPCSVSTV